MCACIQMAQKNKEDLYDLTVMFAPLLKKYAYYLRYEDAYNDLLLDFIELVLKMNLNSLANQSNQTLLAYIQKSIYNCYIKKSKKYSEYYRYMSCFIDEMSDRQLGTNCMLITHDHYHELQDMCEQYLTRAELEIIILIFNFGYNAAEIARIKHVSRQAVNQAKIKALDKLRHQIS